jgi:hypothetical protein
LDPGKYEIGPVVEVVVEIVHNCDPLVIGVRGK